MPQTFSIAEHLRINRGADPLVRGPTPSSACSLREEPDRVDKRAGPGGPARTRGSAPQFMQSSQFRKKYVAWGFHPAPQSAIIRGRMLRNQGLQNSGDLFEDITR